MLRLFGIFVLVLVFSITVIPYSYANHDTIPSYIQNNTGWDREVFHEYSFYPLSNTIGIFYIPYQFDGSIVDMTMFMNYDNSEYYDVNGAFIIEIESNLIQKLMFEFPNFLLNNFLDTTFLVLLDDREVPYYIKDLFLTHTHTTIPIHEGEQTLEFIHTASFEDNHNIINNKIFQLFDKYNYDYIFPPLKQTQNGVESQNILCKENLELVLHPNGSPACVKPESIPKLIERGWVKIS